MVAQKSISAQKLSETAQSFGLVFVSSLPLEKFETTKVEHQERLSLWQSKGFAAEMEYMLREPALFTDFSNFLEGYKSVIQFLIPYTASNEPTQVICPTGHGRIARYAWGRDYHKVIPKKLHQLVSAINGEFASSETINYRVFSDAVPLLERAMAQDSGLGFIGKNSMLIRAGFGSYGFLAEVVWDVDVVENTTPTVKGECGTCSRCITACPTNAFVGDRVLDSKRCISYLTIEKRGPFTPWQREALGEWVFGCDVCQEVCPFNQNREVDVVFDDFSKQRGSGASLELSQLFTIGTLDDYVKRFGGTPLMRAKREGLLRNAAAVAANTKSMQTVDSMIGCYLKEDSSLIRGEILEALKRLVEYADGSIRRRIKAVIEV